MPPTPAPRQTQLFFSPLENCSGSAHVKGLKNVNVTTHKSDNSNFITAKNCTQIFVFQFIEQNFYGSSRNFLNLHSVILRKTEADPAIWQWGRGGPIDENQ